MRIGCRFISMFTCFDCLFCMYLLFQCLSYDITVHCQRNDSDVTEVMVCRMECLLRLWETIKPFFPLGHQLLVVDGCHSPVQSKAIVSGSVLWHTCHKMATLLTTSPQKTKRSWSQETMFPCKSYSGHRFIWGWGLHWCLSCVFCIIFVLCLNSHLCLCQFKSKTFQENETSLVQFGTGRKLWLHVEE